MSSMKPTGPASFTRKKGEPARRAEITLKRDTGTRFGVMLRLSRDNWKRVHQQSQEKGANINEVARVGLSRLYEEEGLKPLD